MKKSFKLPLWCAALALAPLMMPAAAIAGPEAALSQISFNADYLSQNYHETDSPVSAGLYAWDRELGQIPGGAVDFGYLAPPLTGLDNLYIGGEFSYNDGNVNYHGTSIDGTELINSSTKTKIEGGYFEIGKGFYIITPNLMIVPTAFYGERSWDRDLVGDTEDENYHAGQAGVAVHLAWALTNRVTVIGRVAVSRMLAPRMTLSSEGQQLTFSQGAQTLAAAEVGLDVLLASHWHVRGTVGYNGFDYGQSAAVGDYLEPSSSTTDISVKVGVGYDFE